MWSAAAISRLVRPAVARSATLRSVPVRPSVTVRPLTAASSSAALAAQGGLGARRVASGERAETESFQGIHLGPAVVHRASPREGSNCQRFAVATDDRRDETADQQHGGVFEAELVSEFGRLLMACQGPVETAETELEPRQNPENVWTYRPVALGFGSCQAGFDEWDRFSVPTGMAEVDGAVRGWAFHHRHRHESLQLHRAVEQLDVDPPAGENRLPAHDKHRGRRCLQVGGFVVGEEVEGGACVFEISAQVLVAPERQSNVGTRECDAVIACFGDGLLGGQPCGGELGPLTVDCGDHEQCVDPQPPRGKQVDGSRRRGQSLLGMPGVEPMPGDRTLAGGGAR